MTAYKVIDFTTITSEDTEDSFNDEYAENYLMFAQSFTPSAPWGTFQLYSIKLKLAKGTATGDLIVEIRNCGGTTPGTLIERKIIPNADIPVASSYLEITNWENVTLTAGQKYAIVFYHPLATETNYMQFKGDDTGQLANGESIISTDFGANWDATCAHVETDFYIEVYAFDWDRTLCTYQEVLDKAGANANATAKTLTYVSRYVLQAENQLNARTRYNWTDKYASLSADVKYFLGEIVSNLAAIKVINYDMSGYRDRLEAEGMKQTLRNEAEVLMQELKERQVQTFMENAT